MHDPQRDIGPGDSAPTADVNGVAPRQALPVDRFLELLAVFVIAAGLLGLAAALAGLFHALHVLLAAVFVVSGYGWWTRGERAELANAPCLPHLLLILLVALFFRVPAYLYVLGGQDEGVYVNMAAHLVRTGSLVPSDPLLQRVEQPSAVEHYLADNYEPRSYLPGVYRFPGNPPRLQFQFYHLFPVWMALVGGVLGFGASVYALTFLALISVAFLYRLTLALTGSRLGALFAGLLIAVNPLHAFFSKFPVTEVATLAFSAMAFTLLALYCVAPPAARRRRWLGLSALAMFCLFTTRISGFLYLPFLLLLSVASLVCDRDVARRTAVHRWTMAVVSLYAVSVAYGMRWSSFYAGDVYRFSFEGLLGVHWKAALQAFTVVVLISWVALRIASGSDRLRETLSRVATVVRRLLGPALLPVVLIGAYKAYQLGFTTRYSSDAWLGPRFHLAGERWRGVAGSSLVVSAEYLCPLLFLAFLFLLLRRWREPRMEVVLLFLSYFVVHLALLEWVVPYQPYFARYLVSEFVPYTVLFVVCAWAFAPPGRLRKTLSAVLLVSGLYAAALSAAQIGKNENDQAYQSIGRLAAPVDDGDLLLIDSERVSGFAVSELKTPLVFAFGRQVADIRRSSLADTAYLAALRAPFGDVFLVSSAAVPPDGFGAVDALPFRVLAFWHGIEPPVRTFWRIDTRLYLYKLQNLEVSSGTLMRFGAGGVWNDLLDANWSVPEPWGIWALGHSATMQITPRLRRKPIERIRLRLRAFVSPPHPEQRVIVRLDREPVQELRFRYPDATALETDLPLKATAGASRGARPITIEFVMPDSVSPQSLGLSNDGRVIGVGLESLELLESRPAPGDQVDSARHRP